MHHITEEERTFEIIIFTVLTFSAIQSPILYANNSSGHVFTGWTALKTNPHPLHDDDEDGGGGDDDEGGDDDVSISN